jgi:hypothetical protein
MPSIIACSISEPQNPDDFIAKISKLKLLIFLGLIRNNKTSKIFFRSLITGNPIKKISSKRPLRIISKGSTEKLFAVATTNTCDIFSDNQIIIKTSNYLF